MKAWLGYAAAGLLLGFGLSFGTIKSTTKCYQLTDEGRAACRYKKEEDLFYKELKSLRSRDAKYLEEHEEDIVRSYERARRSGFAPVFGMDSMELRLMIRDVIEQKLGRKT